MNDKTQKNSINSPAKSKSVCLQMEVALKAFAKLLVSIRFYPSGHPSLKDVTADAKASVQPLFINQDSVVVAVRRNGFFVGDEPVGSTNPMLQKLSAGLFMRKVQQLMFLKDLSCRDLWETAQVLLLDTATIQKQGGVQQLLQKAQVTTIWTNVVDVKGIFEIKNKLEEEKLSSAGTAGVSDEEFLATLGSSVSIDQPSVDESDDGVTGQAPSFSSDDVDFEELLSAVEKTRDDQEFSALLHRLVPVVLDSLNEKFAHLVLRTLFLLTDEVKSRDVNDIRRIAVTQAVSSLSITQVFTFYMELLCARVRFDAPRLYWDKINRMLGTGFTKVLLARLGVEEDQGVKKVLLEALVSQGEIALKPVLSTLQDDRWSVLRYSIYLAGELGDTSSIDALRPLLQHRDLRVRRETLRALARIGGSSVIAILAKIMQEGDTELSRQAMLCLGTIKTPAAMSLLIQFVQEKDWRFTRLEAKIDAVRALGEIGSGDALPALEALAANRCLFYSNRNNELRAAALLAIGAIGGKEALRVLEIYDGSANPVIAKAAKSAIRQVKKGEKRDE